MSGETIKDFRVTGQLGKGKMRRVVREQGRETTSVRERARREDYQPARRRCPVGIHELETVRQKGRMRARWLPLVCVLAAVHGAARIASADEPAPPGHVLQAVGGLGYSFSLDEGYDGRGSGGFLEAEYVFRPFRVFTPRLYAGGLLTFPEERSCGSDSCDVQSKIFFAGAKLRIMAPIPYVGPFFEFGLGASFGYLRTLDRGVDETARGATIHVPFAIGLAVGPRHEFDLAFSYLVHPKERQVGGGVVFGIGFSLP